MLLAYRKRLSSAGEIEKCSGLQRTNLIPDGNRVLPVSFGGEISMCRNSVATKPRFSNRLFRAQGISGTGAADQPSAVRIRAVEYCEARVVRGARQSPQQLGGEMNPHGMCMGIAVPCHGVMPAIEGHD